MTTSPARRGSGVVAMMLLLVAGGCYRPRSTPGPQSGFEQVDSLRPSDAALAAYVARLRFDTVYGDGDEQRLMVGRDSLARYGPLVRIQPESAAYLLRSDELAQGRIIARMINASDEAYPKLGLAPHSITYWWAQAPAVRTQEGKGNGRAVFISTDMSGRILSRTVTTMYYEHHGRRYTSPSARWLWDPADEKGWAACDDGCCRSPF